MMVELPPDVAAAITSRVDDSDLQELAANAVGAARMVIDKVLASRVDSTTYRLPADPGSPERRFLARVLRLSAASRTKLGNEARARLRPGMDDAAVAARTRIYGAVGALDPTSAVALLTAVRSLERPAALKGVVERAARRVQQQPEVAAASAQDPNVPVEPDVDPGLDGDGGGVPQPPPSFVPTELQLILRRVDQVHRVREPGELFEGSHEMAIGAVVFDMINGTRIVVAPRRLGEFDAAAKSFNLPVCRIPLLQGANDEQAFLVKLFLAEIDQGGFAEHIEENGHLGGDTVLELLAAGVERQVLCPLEEATGLSLTPGSFAALLAGFTYSGFHSSGEVISAFCPHTCLAIHLFIRTQNAVCRCWRPRSHQPPVGPRLFAVQVAIAVVLAGLGIASLIAAAEDDFFGPRVLPQGVRPDSTLTSPATPETQRFERPVGREKTLYDVDLRWQVITTTGTPLPPRRPTPTRTRRPPTGSSRSGSRISSC